MPHDSFSILKQKLKKLVEEASSSEKNKKTIDAVFDNIGYSELYKYKILIDDVLEVESRNIDTTLFEEFSKTFTKLKDKGYETFYIEKILKNFSEEDYEESLVNAGKSLESVSKKILYTEEETDTLNTLIHLLYIEGKINRSERSELEKIRDCRNQNAHGNEIHTEISKISTENYILKTFELINKLIK